VWEEIGFVTRFLYGSQQRFTFLVDGKVIASGDIRDETVLKSEDLELWASNSFTGATLQASNTIKGASIEYLTVQKSQMSVTYFRLRQDEKTVGIGFFGDPVGSAHAQVDDQVATAYFLGAGEQVMDLSISYKMPVPDDCVVMDVAGLIVDTMGNW
jgi:hypothetical protein